MSDGRGAIKSLLLVLADLFALEGRAGGDAAAKALGMAVDALPKRIPETADLYRETIFEALSFEPHPIAPTIRDAVPFIVWGTSDLRGGRIPEQLANQMPMCELVGPGGMFYDQTVRVGIWMQQPDVTYGPRRHAAEETFLLFAGAADWSTEHNAPTREKAGAAVHHPSNILHTSITTDKPVLAAWRWSGDIRFEQYEMKT